MFSRFLGIDKKSERAPTKDAVDSRGLEVWEEDPDTSWGLWESAVAEQDSRFGSQAEFPTLPDVAPAASPAGQAPGTADAERTVPAALQQSGTEQRKAAALDVVEMHHHRIATSIRSLWGHKECTNYIFKLILDGGDTNGHARIGFNQEAAEAMLVLAEIHDAQFGIRRDEGPLGFGDQSVRAGFDGSR